MALIAPARMSSAARLHLLVQRDHGAGDGVHPQDVRAVLEQLLAVVLAVAVTSPRGRRGPGCARCHGSCARSRRSGTARGSGNRRAAPRSAGRRNRRGRCANPSSEPCDGAVALEARRGSRRAWSAGRTASRPSGRPSSSYCSTPSGWRTWSTCRPSSAWMIRIWLSESNSHSLRMSVKSPFTGVPPDPNVAPPAGATWPSAYGVLQLGALTALTTSPRVEESADLPGDHDGDVHLRLAGASRPRCGVAITFGCFASAQSTGGSLS